MNRQLPYILLFATLLLSQLFLFDKLLISTSLSPLIYVGFIALLPIETSRFWMLICSMLTGVIFDIVTGSAGVASIAIMAVGYYRHHLLNAILGREIVILGGAPTPQRLGWRKFLQYLSPMVLIHNTIFFSLEFLNFDELGFLFKRIIISSALSIVVIWLIAGRFAQLLSRSSKRNR